MSHSNDPHQACRDQLAGFVLGALPDDEAAEVAAHLEACSKCRAHQDWLLPAVDLLPESVLQLAAPASLREHLLATVRSDPEANSAGAEAKADTEVIRSPAPVGGRWRSWLDSLSARPALAVAAVALIIALGAGLGLALRGEDEARERTIAAEVQSAGSRGKLIVRHDGATLEVRNFPRNADDEVFAVWVRRGTVREASTTFSVDGKGRGSAAISGSLDGVDEVVVTREPIPVNVAPTTSPLLSVGL